jgi:hypothetical protein
MSAAAAANTAKRRRMGTSLIVARTLMYPAWPHRLPLSSSSGPEASVAGRDVARPADDEFRANRM